MKKTILPILGFTLGIALGFSIPKTQAQPIVLPLFQDVAPIQAPNSYEESTDLACEGQTHEYSFTNNSTNTGNLRFWTQIHGYAIVLDSDPNYTPVTPGNPSTDDFLTNVDTSTLRCSNGGSNLDADPADEFVMQACGFNAVSDLGDVLYTGPEHGGTRVTYQQLNFIDGTPRGLLWAYGVNNNSFTNFPFLESGETAYTGGISFDPLVVTIPGQTATTEGWVLVEYFQQNTRGTATTSDDTWTHIYPIQVDADQDGNPDDASWDPDGDYEYWWGIEDVNRTIWPACEEALVCEDLNITSPTALTFANVGNNVVTRLQFETEDQNGDPWEGNYLVQGFQSDGVTPSTCEFSNTCWWGNICTNWQPDQLFFDADDIDPRVRNCQLGDIVTIEEVDFPAACNDSLSFEDGCEELNIISTQIINNFFGEFTRVEVNATTLAGQPWPLPYIYSVTNAAGAPVARQFGANVLQAVAATPVTTFQTNAAIVFIRNLQPGDQVDVEAAGGYANVCNDSFQVADECLSMGVTPTTIAVDDIDSPTQITLTPQGANGPWNGTYTYSATNSAGGPSTCEFAPNYAWSLIHFGSNPFTTPLETVWVNDCGQGDIISMVENNYPEVCNGTINIEEEIPPVLACTSLSATPTTLTLTDLTQPTEINLIVNDNFGNPWNGTYSYTASDSSGGPSTCLFYETLADAQNNVNGQNPLTSSQETVWVNGCTGGDTISMTETGAPTVCADTIATETPPPPVCIDLTISPTNVVSSSLPQVFTLTPNPSTWPGPWVWSTTNPLGVFTEVANPANTGNTITTSTLQVSYQGAAGDGITVKEGTIFAEICDATANITPPPVVLACIGLTISPTSVVSSSLPQVFTLTPNPSTWPGPWVWSTTNPLGVFTEVANPANTGNTITTTTLQVSYQGAAGDGITVVEGTTFGAVCNARAEITPPPPPGPYCGDGIPGNTVGEVCDDGNTVDNDACSNSCIPPPKLEVPYCGDKISGNTVGEECDDGNTVDNDACSNSCKIPPGGPPGGGVPGGGGGSNTYCGDGKIQSPNESNPPKYEICDEGLIGGTIDSGPLAGQYCSNRCDITITPPSGPLPQPQPSDELTKSVETYNFGWFNVLGEGIINANGFVYAHDFDYAFYQLTYTPDAANANEVTITDSITDELPSLTPDGNQYDGGVKFYSAVAGDPDQVKKWANVRQDGDEILNDMRIFYEGEDLEVPACEFDAHSNVSTEVLCSENSIADEDGVTLHNLNKSALPDADIVIRYLGQVHNGDKFDCTKLLNPQDSDNYSVCPVQFFRNFAETSTHKSDSSDIAIVCPFFLTRNAGDVYIDPNAELQTYDLSCYYDYKNSDALVISENSTNASSLLSRFSSYIGNLFTKLEDRWKQLTVRSQVKDRNIGAVTRYKENDLNTYLSTNPNDPYVPVVIDDIESPQMAFLKTQSKNPKQNVYQIVGKDLVFNLGNNKVPPGAYTFIVRGGNLRIKSNLTYDDTTPINELSSLKQIPSIAFIVIGGNVEVDSRVSKMVGVYYIQSETTTGPGGSVTQGGQLTGDWTDPFTELEIHGSVYGNINSLLGQRTFAGPANYDHGNVVLRYDERILLNPPPGLEEYVDLSSERVAR